MIPDECFSSTMDFSFKIGLETGLLEYERFLRKETCDCGLESVKP